MRRTILLLGLMALALAGCKGVELEGETGDGPGDQGPRAGLVSYGKPDEAVQARELMTQYCAPGGFTVQRTYKKRASFLSGERTYAQFACVAEKAAK
jgi:hypothetical protein